LLFSISLSGKGFLSREIQLFFEDECTKVDQQQGEMMRILSAHRDDSHKKNPRRRITLGSAWFMTLGCFSAFYLICFVRLHYVQDDTGKNIANEAKVKMMQVKRTLPETFAANNYLRHRMAVFNTTAASTTSPLPTLTKTEILATTTPIIPSNKMAPVVIHAFRPAITATSPLPVDAANASTIPAQHGVSMQIPISPSFRSRHDIVSGYDKAIQYLNHYNSDRPLYLFFICSNDDGTANLWSNDCEEAEKKVYKVFKRSPVKNRLLTIRTGSKAYWQYKNEFRTDRDLRLKKVPAVMRWIGRGETSGVLNSVSTHDEHFLSYLFQIPEIVEQIEQNKKQIDDVHNYEEFLQAVQAYNGSYPLYLLFISGRLPENNRPWCPYCRFSELPVEYAFHSFAHPKARLVRVEVSPSYQEYKKPENPFKHTPGLTIRGVPALFTVTKSSFQSEIIYERLYGSLVTMDWLQETFSNGAVQWEQRIK
jgi:hypothetical protein